MISRILLSTAVLSSLVACTSMAPAPEKPMAANSAGYTREPAQAPALEPKAVDPQLAQERNDTLNPAAKSSERQKFDDYLNLAVGYAQSQIRYKIGDVEDRQITGLQYSIPKPNEWIGKQVITKSAKMSRVMDEGFIDPKSADVDAPTLKPVNPDELTTAEKNAEYILSYLVKVSGQVKDQTGKTCAVDMEWEVKALKVKQADLAFDFKVPEFLHADKTECVQKIN
jgi:hypothetical protein